MNYQPLTPSRPMWVQEIYTVHYFEYTSGCSFLGERHNFWELLYVDRGEIQVTAGEQTFLLGRGRLILHAPGEFHAFSSMGTAPDLVVVSFRCDAPEMEAFRGLTAEAGEEERALLARIVEESAAAFSTPLNDPYAAVLERREDAPFGGEQLLCAALEELLIRLLRRQAAPAHPRPQPRESAGTLEQVMDYLSARLDRQLTLEQVCRDNLAGRSQLQKLFHTHTGGGVMAYFNGLKIQAAQRMIREGRLNFTQIAAQLGFQSSHYFSRRFRQAAGMSPSEYAGSVRMLSELAGLYPDECANNGQDRLFPFHSLADTMNGRKCPAKRSVEEGERNVMNKKPVLVIMAAGMGSRYGGLKQLDPVGNHGQVILDYSIYDARRAGFETVVFVIKPEIEEDFKSLVGARLEKCMDVKYVFQLKEDLPEGYAAPPERTKPWGTAQAALAARHVVDGPFAVINADDYYGPEAFREIYNYLSDHPDGDKYEYAMVGYLLKNTVTENGTVARGVCEETADHFLVQVTERTKIEKGNPPRYTEDDGQTWTELPEDAIVSMNLWGFSRSFLDEAWARFPRFLDAALAENPVKAEYFLPTAVSWLIDEGKARVKVLRSMDKWYGVTYQEDKPTVVAAIAEMTASGLYPDHLWEEK